MLQALAGRIYVDTGRSLWRLLGLAIPTTIVWYIARHIVYWTFSLLFGIEGHRAPPESQIIGGVTFLAGVIAYAVATIVMEIILLGGGIDRIGDNEGVSPTLLTMVIPQQLLGFFIILGFIPALAVLPFYILYHAALLIGRFLGSREAITRWQTRRIERQHANVIGITSGTSWNSHR